MRPVGQLVIDDDDEAGAPLPSLYEIELLVDAALRDPNNGRAAAAFAAIQSLHVLADRYERNLVRPLRWDAKGKPIPGRTWEKIAELLDAGLASKQAAHQRWGRLKARGPGKPVPRRGRPSHSHE